MTVRDVICEFCDSKRYPDMNKEVKFACGDHLVFDGLAGAEIHENGPAIVKLRPARSPRSFMFSLKFEANPIIEAETIEEAEKKAYEMMRDRVVVNNATGDEDDSYEAQEPYFLEEEK